MQHFKMKQNSSINYVYTFGIRQFFNIFLGVGMIGFAIFLYFRFEIDNTLKVLISVFSLLGTIPLLITLHYILRSRGFTINIQSHHGLIEIIHNFGKEIYRTEDIKSVEIHQHKGVGLYEFEFDFAKYTFKNEKYFIATNFMTDEYFVPAHIEPRFSEEFIPIIWKRTNI